MRFPKGFPEDQVAMLDPLLTRVVWLGTEFALSPEDPVPRTLG